MSSHVCPWPRCEAIVPDRMLCCSQHWFALSGHIQRAIKRAYVPGQTASDWSPAYREAFNAAQAFALSQGADAPQRSLL